MCPSGPIIRTHINAADGTTGIHYCTREILQGGWRPPYDDYKAFRSDRLATTLIDKYRRREAADR